MQTIVKGHKAHILFVLAILHLVVSGCAVQEKAREASFELDHLVLFVDNPQMEDTLKQSLWTFGEKLSSQHANQGTRGHYFIFHNTFIEFLYLDDPEAARKNEERFRSKYSQRWKTDTDACPFGFGLTLSPFDTSKTSFPLLTYNSLDSPQGEYYLMSEFNANLHQPLIYVSTPNSAYPKLDSIGQVDDKYEEFVREDFRNYLTHPTGMKKLTKVIITLPNGASGGNIELLSEVKEVEVKKGETYALTLIFDHGSQGKEISLNDRFELNIRY